MLQQIIFIIFVLSLGGIVFFLAKKTPALNSLPYNGTTGIKKHHIISDIENKIKETATYFEKQILLHKLLSWVKVMTLKLETVVDHLLHNIRKRAQKVDKDLKNKK